MVEQFVRVFGGAPLFGSFLEKKFWRVYELHELFSCRLSYAEILFLTGSSLFVE